MSYKADYLKHYGYGEQDYIACEECGGEAVDVHHKRHKGMGGTKMKYRPEDLIALCRKCHAKEHGIRIV